jgi:hypothetical protein
MGQVSVVLTARPRWQSWSRALARTAFAWAMMGVWGLLPLMPLLAALWSCFRGAL